ncbi:23S rRNA (pseudouridine(1915)-N(3))-methyltransferase RlmH [Rhodovibrionaceae bacterium A322]
MHLHLIAIGRAKAGPLRDLYDLYAGRLGSASLLGPLTLREVEEKKALKGPELKSREADLLLAAVPQGARLIALDERGKELDSPQLAQKLGSWRDEGIRETAVIIGGADGLDPRVRQRADLVLAMGRLTWPHMLVRAMIAEQLYRAASILSGHPYHRE